MGTAGECLCAKGVRPGSRARRQDAFSPKRAIAARSRALSDVVHSTRRSPPVSVPQRKGDALSVSCRRRARPGRPEQVRQAQARVRQRRHDHRRQRLEHQRRRGRIGARQRTHRARSKTDTARAHRGLRRRRAGPPSGSRLRLLLPSPPTNKLAAGFARQKGHRFCGKSTKPSRVCPWPACSPGSIQNA